MQRVGNDNFFSGMADSDNFIFETEDCFTYSGTTKNGLKHGFGVEISPNGGIYSGNWKDGKKSGKGQIIYYQGDYYNGDWKEDKANGTGHFISID